MAFFISIDFSLFTITIFLHTVFCMHIRQNLGNKKYTWFIFWQEKERPPPSSLHWHQGTSPGPGHWTGPWSLDLILDPGPWLLLGRSNLGIWGEETGSRRKKARMEDMEKVGVVKDSVLVTHWTIMAHLCYLKQMNYSKNPTKDIDFTSSHPQHPTYCFSLKNLQRLIFSNIYYKIQHSPILLHPQF